MFDHSYAQKLPTAPDNRSETEDTGETGPAENGCRKYKLAAKGEMPSGISLGSLDDPSNITLSGTASMSDRTITLTDNLGQSGGAFYACKIELGGNASFSTSFQFRISQPMGATDNDKIQGADGIAFVVQTSSAKIGGYGGGLGLQGLEPSLGVEFDTWTNGWDADGNHIGIDVNGDLTSALALPVPTPMNNGAVWRAWVDYDGIGKQLSVRLSNGQNLTHRLDLEALLQSREAYVGFTSGTGSAGNLHQILSWDFIGQFAPDRFQPGTPSESHSAQGASAEETY
ncbi:L-type lectin-domain containing protein [Thiogranum longum]|nr:L-type lectin-domain containing protein [Thiogranum longum]